MKWPGIWSTVQDASSGELAEGGATELSGKRKEVSGLVS